MFTPELAKKLYSVIYLDIEYVFNNYAKEF